MVYISPKRKKIQDFDEVMEHFHMHFGDQVECPNYCWCESRENETKWRLSRVCH